MDEYYSALGVEPPKADAQEAETDIQDTDTAESETPEAVEPEEGGADNQPEGDVAEPKKQSRKEDAKYAAARRAAEAERDAAIAKAKADAETEAKRVIDQSIEALGQINPFTGQLIRTKAEYDVYITDSNKKKVNDALGNVGLNKDLIDGIIAEHPDVKAAREAKAAAEAAKLSAETEKASLIADELKQISALDPEIKTVDDLKKLPEYEKYYSLVQKGESLTEAYWAVRGAKILEGQTAGAARQSAINTISKNHLNKSDSMGEDGAEMTQADFDRYRILFPNMSKKDMAAAHARYLKNTRREERK